MITQEEARNELLKRRVKEAGVELNRRNLLAEQDAPSLTKDLRSNIDNLKDDFSRRKQSVVDTFRDGASGEISGNRVIANTLGDVAGGGLDAMGAGISSAVDTVDAGFETVLPNITKSVKDFTKVQLGDAATYISNSTAGKVGLKALNRGVEAYSTWAEENPQDAKTLGSFVNVALVLSPVKKSMAVNREMSLLNKAAGGLTKSAEKSKRIISKKRATAAVMSIKPEAANLETTRTLGFRTTKQTPSKFESLLVDEVSKLNLNKRDSDGEIYDKVSESIREKGASLSDDLAKSDVVITEKVLSDVIDKSIDDLVGVQLGLGSQEIKPILNKVKRIAKDIFRQFPDTPGGMLDARKKLDDWLTASGYEKLLMRDAAQTAQVEAVRTIRRAMNQVVIDAVPDANVAARLESQSLLFSAKDVLTDKKPKEARNSIGALVDSLKVNTSISIPVTPVGLSLLASTGVSTLGGGYGLTALAAGISFGVGKVIMNPSTRIGLAKLISGVDKLIGSGGIAGDKLKQLRVHRAAVLELIENSQISENLDLKESEETVLSTPQVVVKP